jgi:arylsulfatase
MKYLDVLGGPETYEHFPTGWASAFSAPFKMFKRYSQYAGGTNDPLVISWPKGIKAKGEVRNQYHHSVDIVPTLLEAIGLEMPKVYNGVKQVPLSGVSMAYTFDAKPNDPTQKKIQYFAMLGSRGIWKDGWKAAAVHAPLSGKGHFDKDDWELYHVAVDRSESKDLAKENPEKLKELIAAWFDEAEINNVLPLDDRSAAEILTIERPSQEPARDRYIYYPFAAPVPEGNAVNVRGRSFKILANVETTKKTSGVLFAHGSRFGGHSLFIKNNRLYYAYNFLGIKPEQTFKSSIAITPGKHTLGMEFTREKTGKNGESVGTTKLYIDDKLVASGPMRTQPAKFTLSGDGLCVGFDSADAVSESYPTPSKFNEGTLDFVGVTVEGTPYVDLEAEAKRVMMSQ